MRGRGGELVAPDKSTVMSKPLLDSIVVEDSQGDRGLADPASTDQSDWCELLGQIDNLLDQLVAAEERPWGKRWRFSGYATFGREMIDPPELRLPTWFESRPQ